MPQPYHALYISSFSSLSLSHIPNRLHLLIAPFSLHFHPFHPEFISQTPPLSLHIPNQRRRAFVPGRRSPRLCAPISSITAPLSHPGRAATSPQPGCRCSDTAGQSRNAAPRPCRELPASMRHCPHSASHGRVTTGQFCCIPCKLELQLLIVASL